VDGYDFKPKPPRAVTDYLKNKGLKPSFSWLDVWAEEHAFAFTVAKATQINVLTDIREELQRALDDGLPYSEFQKQLKPRLKARGWWGTKNVVDPDTGKKVKARLGSPRRLQAIYSANVRTARAAGQWERIQNNKDVLPYIIYQLGPSEVHRPLHANKQGIILPADDPFWIEWFAPNGWGCKCHHRSVSGREAKRLGYSGQPAPKIPRDKHINKRTGEVTEVPRGIDPGWHTNPGLSRQKNIENFLAEAVDTAPLDLARVAVADLMRDSEFKAHLLGERLLFSIPVAVLPEDLAALTGAKTKAIRVSAETARKHNPKTGSYPPPELWLKILETIETADLYMDASRPGHMTFQFLNDEDGRWYRYVIKLTKDLREIYLTTFHTLPSDRPNRPPRGVKIKRKGN